MNQTNTNEDQLRSEIESLKRQVEDQKRLLAKGHAAEAKGPSSRTFVVVALLFIALVVAGYFLGYLPRQRREQVLAAESKTEIQALPVVNVRPVDRSPEQSNLVLPGNIQAV